VSLRTDVAVAAAFLVAACGAPVPDPGGESQLETPNATSAMISIEEAQKILADSVMPLPEVHGVGIGDCDGTPCLRVFASGDVAELAKRIPSQVPEGPGGYRVDIKSSGPFRAH